MEELIEGAYNDRFILGVLRNIESQMPKAQRKRLTNTNIVANWILLRTSKGGRTSCIRQCNKLGVDPDGYTFFKEEKK
jgi:hypothetical protein